MQKGRRESSTVKGMTSHALLDSHVEQAILVVRGQRVMLDSTLAGLYGVQTGALVQALKRNSERFPDDFCFQLEPDEVENLISQSVISSSGHGGRRSAPYVFTEQGVAMLSSVLRSARAIAVNVEIMRAFVRLREELAANKELAQRFAELEARIDKRLAHQDEAIVDILKAIRALMNPSQRGKRSIGFVTDQVKGKPG
jgi:ORF6N domain